MSYFRLNDIVLNVPPSELSVDHADLVLEWETLRSRHATKIKSGKGENVISVRLTILPEEIWKLHRLLIEFKNTPFWEVDNLFIRRAIDPMLPLERNIAVAAESINISSVPTNPGTWEAELLLKYFNYAPYGSNFQYRKDWNYDAGKHGVKTIYEIEVGESNVTNDLDDEVNSPGPKPINDVVPEYPFVKLESHITDIADLNPMPYNEAPTQPVDASESNLYVSYINFLQAKELEEHYGISAINKVITSSFKDGRAQQIEYPADLYMGNTAVRFRWKEFMVIPTNAELAQLMSAAVQQLSNEEMPSTLSDDVNDKSWFMPIDGRITSKPGPRNIAEEPRASKDHKGTDIAAVVGTPVIAPTDGTIIKVVPTEDGNNAGIRIWMDDGTYSHGFFHLSKVLVSVGDRVVKGQAIAFSGDTGIGTGPHLHWEVRVGGVNGTVIYGPAFTKKPVNKAYTRTVTPSQIPDLLEEDKLKELGNSIKQELDDLSKQGWLVYRSPHTANVLFRTRELSIKSSGTGEDNTICTGMGSAYKNRFASIPIVGHEYPTMQFLGGYDNSIFMTFASITHGLEAPGQSVGVVDIHNMIRTLEWNARNVRMIPDSWTLDVESFITKLSGHKTYVVDRVRSDTQPNNPGLSTLELTLSSSLLKPPEKLVKSGNLNTNDAIQKIIDRLLSHINIAVAEGREKTAGITKEYYINQTFYPMKKTPSISNTPLITDSFDRPDSVVPVFDFERQLFINKGWIDAGDPYILKIANPFIGDDQKANVVRGELIGKPIVASDGYARAYKINAGTDDFTNKLVTDLAKQEFAGIDADLLIGGQESTRGVENVFFVKREDTSDDSWLSNRTHELISLMQVLDAALSDKFYGGFSRQELMQLASFYGLEKWVLPSYETQAGSKTLFGVPQIGGFNPKGAIDEVLSNPLIPAIGAANVTSDVIKSLVLGNSSILSDVLLAFETRFLTNKKFNSTPSGKLEGFATLLPLGAASYAEFILTGDGPLAELISGRNLEGLNDAIGDAVASVLDTVSGRSFFSNQLNASRAVMAQDKNQAFRLIGPEDFEKDELDLIQTLREIVTEYFNRTWFNPESAVYAEAAQRPEFSDIYEGLTRDRLHSETPCYPDLDLPAHPYFGLNLFTFPDFYLYDQGLANATEAVDLQNSTVANQMRTIVENSYQSMKQFEQGTRDKIGTEVHIGDDGCKYDGSDHAGSNVKEYRSDRDEIRKIEEQFVTEGGHLEIRNTAGALQKEPTLDQNFALGNRDPQSNVDGLVQLAMESVRDLERRKLVFRRAFPTFKLFFVENDDEENSWRALDDFYSYNAIRSIVLTRSYKIPSDLLVVELQNVSGVLNGSLVGGITDQDYSYEDTDKNGELTEKSKMLEKFRSAEFENTELENFFDSVVLREGMNIQLRLGFSNNPSWLETVFNGRVVEVEWSDNSDLVRIVCQSFAAELVQVKKGVTGEDLPNSEPESATNHKTLSYAPSYENTTELLSALIKSPEVLHFGRWEFGTIYQDEEIVSPEFDTKKYKTLAWRRLKTLIDIDSNILGSNFRAADFGSDIEKDFNKSGRLAIAGIASLALAVANPNLFAKAALGVTSIASLVGASYYVKKGIERFFQIRWKNQRNNPADDNIFAPHPTDYVDYGIWDFTGKITDDMINYHLLDTTIWDTFQEMTYRHPGWITSPVPYGDRMTMFFGVPSQRYWAVDATSAFVKQVTKLRDKIKNKPNPDPKDLSTYLRALKLRFRPFRNYHLWTSNTDIVSNDISVSSYGVTNTTTVHFNSKGYFDPTNGSLDSIQSDSLIMKYHPDMPDEDILMSEVAFENCNGREMAFRYGLKTIADGLKEMYKGTIVGLGDPTIKPFDIIFITDTYNDMSGPIEVEEVTHFFSPATGFISVVVPKAVVVMNELSSTPLLDAIAWGAIRKASQYYNLVQLRAINAAEEYPISTRIATAGLGITLAPLAGGFSASVTGQLVGPEALASLYSIPNSLYTASVAGAVGGLMGGLRFVFHPGKKTSATIIPLTSHGTPMVAGIPQDIPDTLWHAYRGKWKRWTNDIRSGVREASIAAVAWGFNVSSAYDDDMNLIEKLAINTLGSQ